MLKHKSADVAQSVERRLGKAEVGGSSPLGSFIAKKSALKLNALFLISVIYYLYKLLS